MVAQRSFPDIFHWAEGFPGLLSWPPTQPGQRSMRTEEFAENGRFVVRVEIPGLDPEKDLTVQLDRGELVIRAERQERHREGGRSEFVYGSFLRRISLPEGADESALTARYSAGILEISVPIQERRTEIRTVPIQSGGD